MIVLLDIDNTLIDFNECARHTIIKIFNEFNLPYNDNVFKTFIEENIKIWKRLEKGEISKAYLRANRWNIILEKLELVADGPIIEELFENGISESAYEVEGAKEMLDYLYPKHDLYVVSNGFRFVQENRLTLSNFKNYFKGMFFSEDIGISKPQKEFFDYCFEQLNSPKKENVILIGDSLSADIIGGNNYNIKTIWFNKNNEKCPDNIKPTYTVRTLSEIQNII
jgi:YjjG family noncanonical pyrimidine nucleotidase